MFQFCVRATSGKPPLLPPEKYKKNAQNTKKPNAELYFLSHRLNESILLVISQKLSFSIFVWKKFLFSLFFGKLSIWFALFHNFCKFACSLFNSQNIRMNCKYWTKRARIVKLWPICQRIKFSLFMKGMSALGMCVNGEKLHNRNLKRLWREIEIVTTVATVTVWW